MIPLLSGLAHWLALVAGLALPGCCAWRYFDPQRVLPARDLLLRITGGLVLLAVTNTLVVLALRAALASGDPQDALNPTAWLAFARATRSGHLLVAQGLFALMGAAVWCPPAWRRGAPAAVAGLTVLALASLLCASPTSHAASGGAGLILIHALHLATVAWWFGGLLTLVVWLTQTHTPGRGATLRALAGFSRVALPMMVTTVVSGCILAWTQIAPVWASLVATQYGILLIAKLTLLAVILLLAACTRWRWLPRALAAAPSADRHWRLLGRALSAEWVLALVLLMLATGLASSIPGAHATIDNWPYPWRFSLVASWPEPGVPGCLAAGLALLVLGVVNGLCRHSVWLTSASVGGGLSLILTALAVPANSNTYRTPSVAFDAISIAHGAQLYAQYCTSCHGLQGKGDGPLAQSTPKAPVDLLTQPHTARHTPGDFFHWVTYGIPGSGMPSFAASLEVDARWDLVNFLHAIRRGYDARILSPTSVPEHPEPGLAAPDFAWRTRTDERGTLQNAEPALAVVVVLYTRPASDARLRELAKLPWATLGARLLAVPLTGAATPLPFAVIEDTAAIARTYSEFRRTLSNPDLFGAGQWPVHMELLIDRYGYLRARWIPATDGTGWAQTGVLAAEITRLNAEPRLLPPPAEHVH